MLNVKKTKRPPKDYHAKGKGYIYGKKYLGEIRKEDGSYYSNRERNKYYSPLDRKGHHAKTPLQIAKFAIQEYSKKNDWVFDPFMGAGTTAVEALLQERNVIGIEIDPLYKKLILDNIKMNNPFKKGYKIFIGDSLKTEVILLRKIPGVGNISFSLIVANPPYAGNRRQLEIGKASVNYDKKIKNNLGHLEKHGEEYYQKMGNIFYQSIKFLKKGGYFALGTRDFMRNKKPFLNHSILGDILNKHPEMNYEGLYVLKHYPTTLSLNTYKTLWGVNPVYYQSILIFKKKGK